MPEKIKLKENHICSRCHHKIKKDEMAEAWYYSDKIIYRHIDISCNKK
jgi:hypothetical protein